ncbi:MAG: rRNA maturation RNase YbeY [Nitrospiraceae bacterium]|nr:rRNA maturation RNase YbeY [Nitrospiraceae bacterium]
MRRALTLLGLPGSEVSVLFVNAARMRELNFCYRGQDKVTDVLSFPMEGGPPIPANVLGDVVVCIPRAVEQSREYGVTLSAELRRLLIHGLLHLLGYDHETSAYQKRRMQAKERELLDAL